MSPGVNKFVSTIGKRGGSVVSDDGDVNSLDDIHEDSGKMLVFDVDDGKNLSD